MRPLSVFPFVCSCVLLLGRSGYFPGAGAALDSSSSDLRRSVDEPASSRGSSPPFSTASVVPPLSSSATATEPQSTQAAPALSSFLPPALVAGTPVSALTGGPISTIGTLMVSLSPGASPINDLFVSRPPSALRIAGTPTLNKTHANATRQRPAGDGAASANPESLGAHNTAAAFAAASTVPTAAEGPTRSGVYHLRARRLQRGTHRGESRAKHGDDEGMTAGNQRTERDREYTGFTRNSENATGTESGSAEGTHLENKNDADNAGKTSSNYRRAMEQSAAEPADEKGVTADAEKKEDNGDFTGLDRDSDQASGTESNVAGRALSTKENGSEDAGKVDSSNREAMEQTNNSSSSTYDGKSGTHETHNQTLRSAADVTPKRDVDPVGAVEEGRHDEKQAAVTTEPLKHDPSTISGRENKAAALSADEEGSEQQSGETRTNTSSTEELADSVKKSKNSPARAARARMPFYGGGPTFVSPAVIGAAPVNMAAVNPLTLVLPSAPVQVMQPAAVAVQPVAVAVQPATVAVQPATVAVQPVVPAQVATPVQVAALQAVAVQPVLPVQQTASVVPAPPAATTMSAVAPVIAAVAPVGTVALTTPLIATAPAVAAASAPAAVLV